MVNEWNKTALVAEFETMLRRRLKNGAAPVAACAGFDLDAASAYLEGALGGSHRAGYESHLAGCATCRRHLIELARLAQSVPFTEAQPVAAPVQISTWGRWKEAVAVWFDISSRNFKWQIAGATGAAFAILITALGAQSLRQAYKQESESVASANRTAEAPTPEATEQPLQASAPEPSSQYADNSGGASIASQAMASNQDARSQALAPAPHVGPQGPPPDVVVEPRNGSLALNSNPPGEAPGVATRMPSVPEGQNTASRLSAIAETESMTSVSRAPVNGRASMDAPSDFKEESAKVVNDPVQTLRHSPPPGLNRMKPGQPDPNVRNRGALSLLSPQQAAPTPEPSSKPAENKSTSLIKEIVTVIAKRNPFKGSFNSSEPEQKESADDESANILEWPFQGKVFLFVKGMWIDKEYKPEMQQWRRWALTRGSDEYKRVLAEEPQLKAFFDKGPILIVWKNQIYKVLK